MQVNLMASTNPAAEWEVVGGETPSDELLERLAEFLLDRVEDNDA
jgi:hypothetical protein